jgi:hypothetical protein
VSELGFVAGEKCNRAGCAGIIAETAVENCSCHISAPCSGCTSSRYYCETCDWHQINDRIINDYVCRVDSMTGNYTSWKLRELDATKIDWYSKPHTHFTMIKEGVYPPSATKAEVLELVKGTFGGRFEYFSEGKFKYVAYTD